MNTIHPVRGVYRQSFGMAVEFDEGGSTQMAKAFSEVPDDAMAMIIRQKDNKIANIKVAKDGTVSVKHTFYGDADEMVVLGKEFLEDKKLRYNITQNGYPRVYRMSGLTKPNESHIIPNIYRIAENIAEDFKARFIEKMIMKKSKVIGNKVNIGELADELKKLVQMTKM